MTGKPRRLHFLLAYATVYLVWGSTYLAIRYGVETIPPFVLAGFRFLLAGAMLAGWASARGAARASMRQWKDAAIVGGLMLLGGNGLVCWAETSVPSGIAALIIATVPIFVVVFQWQRPAFATVAGIVLGFTGIALLVGPNALGASARVDPRGAGALLVAAASWAVGSLYARRADRPASALQAAGLQMLAGGALLVVVAAITGQACSLSIRPPFPTALPGRCST